MPVAVVAVVMAVRVFVVEVLMGVRVAMRLGQMQRDAYQHQRAAQRHHRAG